MNYTSVQAIIDAGTTNMTTRVSSANDDGTIEISSPPSWLKYNGITPSTMYTSGNTWIGVGSATEHIKFNRRDTKIYYFYTEEGTLYNYYNFYKMRWRGYSRWNESGSSYYQEWEVIFFDTGDLMIHAVSIPTTYYDGSFNIVASQTYSYTAPTTANPYVSFYSQNEDNSVFTISYSLIDIPMPFDKRWLIKDGDVFYNITDGVLTALSITELTAQNMLDYGNEEPPDGSLLIGLMSPTIYHWNNSTEEGFIPTQPQINATLTAAPYTQRIALQVDMSNETITGIESVTAQYSGNPTVSYSLDDGETFVTEMALTDFLQLNFTELYEGLPTDKLLYLRLFLHQDESLTNILFTFTNT